MHKLFPAHQFLRLYQACEMAAGATSYQSAQRAKPLPAVAISQDGGYALRHTSSHGGTLSNTFCEIPESAHIYIYILRLVQCLMGAQPLESFTLCHTGALPTKDRLCLTHPHGGTPASSKSYQSSRRHGLGRGGAGEGPRTICCARGFCPYFWGVREPYPAKVRLCLTNLHGGTPASAKSGSTSLTSCCRTIVLLLKLSVFLLTQLRMSWFYNDLEFQLGLFLP